SRFLKPAPEAIPECCRCNRRRISQVKPKPQWLSAICALVLAAPVCAQTGLFTITTGSTLPDATQQVAYSQQLSSSGGAGAVTWPVSGGSLPSGLGLSSSGAISGTPTQSGSFSFTVRATDARQNMASKAFSLTVAQPLAISTPSP